MDFKNSFVWLTGMKKLIFYSNNFFGSGHFLIHQTLTKGQKSARSKNLIEMKIQFFHARQPCIEIFEIHSLLGCFFMTSFPKFVMATTITGVEFFCWKSVSVVFF